MWAISPMVFEANKLSEGVGISVLVGISEVVGISEGVGISVLMGISEVVGISEGVGISEVVGIRTNKHDMHSTRSRQ